jgi:hypothetical protein
MEEIHFKVLFDGYFKDLINFYKLFEDSCKMSDNGVLIFDKLKVVFTNKIKNDKDYIDIKQCHLNLTVTKKLIHLKKEISENNIIRDSNEEYFKIISPSGLTVKIQYSDTFQVPSFEIPFNGDIKILDNFYNALGIESYQGVLNLEDIVFYFFTEKEDIPIMSDMFEFSFFTDNTVSNIKQIVRDEGGNVIEYMDDFLGKMLIIRDPSKLILIIGF